MIKKDNVMQTLTQDEIKTKIYTIRGIQVMLDRDLAELYGVETRVLNQAVKRNIERFPENFMFQLAKEEVDSLRSQFVILKKDRGGHTKYLPLVFSEQGVSMLAGVLKSEIAIQVSIKIINVFVEMRRFLLNNAQVFQRLDTVEKKQIEYKIDSDKKFDKIFEALEQNEIKPKQGIFFDGQIFDAYKFISELVRKANKSIVIIDNYIDESVLNFLTKRNKNVKVTILTKNISNQLKLDIEKYNAQYPVIEVKEFKYAHDRFIILDEKDVYVIGASLKDLGKKWFAFSKIDVGALQLIEKINVNLSI
jgi:hypothetical protein